MSARTQPYSGTTGPIAQPERADYHRQWRAFSVRFYTSWFLLGSWPFVAYGLFWLSRYHIHEPILCLVGILLWLVAALSAVWWAGEFRCPRCRRRYAALGHKPGDTNYTRGFFNSVCSNCKLRRFENG